MSWYYIIQFYSIGFAFGFIAALAMNRRKTRSGGGYKKGVNDCRNCKYLEYITERGNVYCKKIYKVMGIPETCTKYRRTEAAEGDS